VPLDLRRPYTIGSIAGGKELGAINRIEVVLPITEFAMDVHFPLLVQRIVDLLLAQRDEHCRDALA
jgi:hypothetical protein